VALGVHEGDESLFRDTARRFGYADRIEHVSLSSTDPKLPSLLGEYDLIFVDGNHSAAFVKNDLALTWPRVKPGGLLVGHDWTQRFPGVVKEADAMNGECNFRIPAGTSLFYARKGMR